MSFVRNMHENKHKFFDENFLARLEQLHLIAKRITTRPSAAMRRSHRLGDGLEFADHRDYAPGDDIRFIDWPYFARMEKLLLRMFHEHSDTDVTILLDTSASMAPGGRIAKFDYARKTAAALAYVAMGSLQRVNLLPFARGISLSREMHTGRNRGQILEVLEFLADLETGGDTELARSIVQLTHRAKSPRTVLIISDFLDCDDQLSDSLVRLRLRGHDAAVLHLYSPADASGDLAGPMLLKHSEDERQLSVNVSDDLLQSYREQWRQFINRCESACLAREAIYIAASTDIPFEQLILKTLRKAGVIGA